MSWLQFKSVMLDIIVIYTVTEWLTVLIAGCPVVWSTVRRKAGK